MSEDQGRYTTCRILECQQGSQEWHQARLGVPSASKIHCVVTPQGKPTASAARKRYALDLVAERLTKIPTFVPCSFAMQRGTDLEPEAREWYRSIAKVGLGLDVREVGFCIADGGLCGASPDGLVGDDGGIEIKCPEMPHYLEIIESGVVDPQWVLQCHHAMYVTGRAWWDFVLYTDVHPFSGWIRRIDRDTVMCGKIHEAVMGFAKEVNDMEDKIRAAAGITDAMLDFDPPVMIGDDDGFDPNA